MILIYNIGICFGSTSCDIYTRTNVYHWTKTKIPIRPNVINTTGCIDKKYSPSQITRTGTSSAIKTNVDKFYTDKLSSYTSKLDTNAGFCGDRSTLNLQANVGTGTMTTYYKAYLRVEENTPILTFENANDYYTMTNSSTGNKALTYPIGLISIDEAILGGHAGGVFNGAYNHLKKSVTNYLTTGTDFWTMSPVAYFYAFSTMGLSFSIHIT